MTKIASFAHAATLVAAGDISASDVRDVQSAIFLRTAFEERMKQLESVCPPYTEMQLMEGQFIRDQIANLDCDWG